MKRVPLPFYYRLESRAFGEPANRQELAAKLEASAGVYIDRVAAHGSHVVIRVSAASADQVDTSPLSAREETIVGAAPVVGASDVPVPQSFAVMRNFHEAMRMALKDMKRLLDEEQYDAFRREYADYCRARHVCSGPFGEAHVGSQPTGLRWRLFCASSA